MFGFGGLVSSDDSSDQTSPTPLLITTVVVFLCILTIGRSIGIGCFWYIVIRRFSICDTRSYWYQITTTCIYGWPECVWMNQMHYMWWWSIHSTSFTGRVYTIIFVLPRVLLHSYMFLLIGSSLGHFHFLGCIGSPVSVIIQSWQRCPYPVAISNNNITCCPFPTQFNIVVDYWSICDSSITFSIISESPQRFFGMFWSLKTPTGSSSCIRISTIFLPNNPSVWLPIFCIHIGTVSYLIWVQFWLDLVLLWEGNPQYFMTLRIEEGGWFVLWFGILLAVVVPPKIIFVVHAFMSVVSTALPLALL